MNPIEKAVILGLGALALWAISRGARSAPTYTGAPLLRDLGWNYPPVYPDSTGSGAVMPSALWPDWTASAGGYTGGGPLEPAPPGMQWTQSWGGDWVLLPIGAMT